MDEILPEVHVGVLKGRAPGDETHLKLFKNPCICKNHLIQFFLFFSFLFFQLILNLACFKDGVPGLPRLVPSLFLDEHTPFCSQREKMSNSRNLAGVHPHQVY